MSGAGLSDQSRRRSPDRSVDPVDYFGGAHPTDTRNADTFGLDPREPDVELHRVSYLYLLVFGNEQSPTEYGGIQVRAQTHLYLEPGNTPALRFQKVMQRAAHRGAHIFNSDVETGAYAYGGGWADGYLDGFDPVENGAAYRNWEVEPVARDEADTAGKIEWTTEIYLEVEGTNYANLSGVASGIANPWDLNVDEQPEQPPIEAQQEWWHLSENFNQARGAYQIAPPGRTAARRRGQQALHGKDVYVNGLYIGEIDKEGRVWLKKEYAGGDTYRGQHSRESILAKTPATPQALALGRKIAKIDESPRAVYLATKQYRPPEFDPADPDEIEVDREVRPGDPGGTIRLLELQRPEESTEIEVRQDEEVIRHLGLSNPPYTHEIVDMWRWPGDRNIAEYGAVVEPDEQDQDADQDQDDDDDGGANLDLSDFGGGR